MPLLFIYLIKLSVSLAVMYLFYQFLLRRLTFYNHNRWYLIGYSLLCFFIAFINISPALEKTDTSGYDILTLVPAVENFTGKVSPVAGLMEGLTIWDWLMIVLLTGTLVMLTRLIIQFISFKRIKRKARLIADDTVKFYQVDKKIIPFSFGNSIFINQQLHTEAELKEIIKHEFVHVKQRHTIDIIWAEVVCILNWYNPFAWLIRKAIRQNLEFIADSRVLANGMDKKQYQYMLLKVIGNNHFRIANQFNFSSLKKRIIMMNRIRSAKVHLIKFLFVLPLMAVLLLAFRESGHNSHTLNEADRAEFLKKNPDVKSIEWVYDNVFDNNIEQIILNKKDGINETYYVNDKSSITRLEKKYDINHSVLMHDLALKEHTFVSVDTIPGIAKANSKGYFIDVKNSKGNCIVVIKTKDGQEVKKLLLTDWNKKEKYYEDLYGEIESPSANCDVPDLKAMPVQLAQPAQPAQPAQLSQPTQSAQPTQPLQPSSPKSPIKIKSLTATDEGSKPLMIVDGVEWPSSLDINMIDPNKIETVSVLKETSAINQYGNRGKYGVLIIKTRTQTVDGVSPVQVRIKDGTINSSPVYYLNGQQTTKETVDLIEPANIKSVDVLKGSKAEEKYGEKGKNGVIEIKTINPVPPKVNYIEKKNFPKWDIRDILGVKKKDEC